MKYLISFIGGALVSLLLFGSSDTSECKSGFKVIGQPEQMEVIYIPDSSFDLNKHRAFIETREFTQ